MIFMLKQIKNVFESAGSLGFIRFWWKYQKPFEASMQSIIMTFILSVYR